MADAPSGDKDVSGKRLGVAGPAQGLELGGLCRPVRADFVRRRTSPVQCAGNNVWVQVSPGAARGRRAGSTTDQQAKYTVLGSVRGAQGMAGGMGGKRNERRCAN